MEQLEYQGSDRDKQWDIKSSGGVIEYMGKEHNQFQGGAKIGICWETSNYGEWNQTGLYLFHSQTP